MRSRRNSPRATSSRSLARRTRQRPSSSRVCCAKRVCPHRCAERAASTFPTSWRLALRDVLVAQSEVRVARDVLLQADGGPLVPDSAVVASPLRVLAGVVIALALAALLVWLGTEFLISAQALHWVLRG